MAGLVGSQTLYIYGEYLMSGLKPNVEFNYSKICFAPKGDTPADSIEVLRAEADCRPLSLKNTDNKIITGVIVERFRAFSETHTHKYQRGFVPKRNFLNNVVDLDAAARIFL